MKRMYRVLNHVLLLTFLGLFISFCSNKRSGPPKVLVFSKTAGYHHASIPAGIQAIRQLGEKNGFEVDTTTNAAMFTEDSLKQYSAVIFLSTTGNVLNHYQEADFRRYIEAGGGYVGIHAAADTEYHWGWYGRLVGGYFLNHPGIDDPYPNVQEGTLHLEDPKHPATEFLPNPWTKTDEWYSYKNFNKDVNVLMSLDENSYKGGADMGFHPMAWYHDYDGGRAFYTGLGHTKESYSNDLFLKHVLAGIQYAIGDNKQLDYSDVPTERVPAANRFSKVSLIKGKFTEPTEMTILPNKDVLIAQRRGEILFYNHLDSTVSRAGSLDVYWKTDKPNVNAEEGLLGIKADPNFAENHHVFVYYSPADTSVNRLSRFTFEDGKLKPESENIILELYSQRQICCHTGGSIAFGKNGLLYLSTGDNTTPFDEPNQQYVSDGYAPLDDRPGHEQYDALRTAGDANDLRGKILRIKVNEDGTYDIPKGNLYPKGMEGTRPEIYVQGNRNPYRISVDKKTGYLYWGEVGPDASKDSLKTRGPKGYDEINQAREAGFYGWPMFIGNNYAYHRYNYATGESGKAFDPMNPTNNSRNNTGIKELPPAQPAFVWYPYDASEQFPQVGTGGRNAMAGPVYYTDMYPKETRLPEYYNGKLFIYDWIRDWIKVVTMQPNGDFDKMEPFMPDTKFHHVIDMEVGPDGQIYLLEYGSGWFTKNPNAGLAKIVYNSGNRTPVVHDISVDKTSGTLPLKVTATVDASDPEGDELTYVWKLKDGTTEQTSQPKLTHTFKEIGEYDISVEVKDGHGHTAQSHTISVYAGNEAPVVDVQIKGNSTFYFPGQPVEYSVKVQDEGKTLDPEGLSSLFVSADYVESSDMAEASQGHKIMTETMIGKNLIQTYDCQACHALETQSVGPSYKAVAERYQDSTDISSYLVNKIIEGGSGVWGDRAMPAHAKLSKGDAQKIVSWIMSLSGEGPVQESLPATGQVQPTLDQKPKPSGVLILAASYTDQGSGNTKPLTGVDRVSLRNNTMSFAKATALQGYSTMTYNGNLLMMAPLEKGSFKFSQIDLAGISSVQLTTVNLQPVKDEYVFELHLNAPDGPKVGEVLRKAGIGKQQGGKGPYFAPLNIPVEMGTKGVHDLYIVSKPTSGSASDQLILANIIFQSK